MRQVVEGELLDAGLEVVEARADDDGLAFTAREPGAPSSIRVTCSNGDVRSRAALRPKDCFVRIDRGELSGAPLHAGLVDTRHAVVQVVSGPGWIRAGALPGTRASLDGSTEPERASYRSLLRELLDIVSEIGGTGPGVAPDGGPGWAFAVLDDAGMRAVPRHLVPAGIAGTALSVLAPAVPFLVTLPLDLWPLFFYVPQFTLPVALGALVVARMKKRSVLAAHSAGQRVAQALRSSRLFDALEPVRHCRPRTPAVLTALEAQVVVGYADTRVVALGARSTRHDLSLEMRLHAVRWPPGVIESCRVLPDSWIVCELRGPPEALACLPRMPGEVRGSDRVRWLELTAEESILPGGIEALEALLTRSSPYR